jgi:hypothetical protein
MSMIPSYEPFRPFHASTHDHIERARTPRCGDIGEPRREITIEPLEEPATEPVTVPVEPEKVPA